MHLMLQHLVARELVIQIFLVKAVDILKLLNRLNGAHILNLSIPFEGLETKIMALATHLHNLINSKYGKYDV